MVRVCGVLGPIGVIAILFSVLLLTACGRDEQSGTQKPGSQSPGPVSTPQPAVTPPTSPASLPTPGASATPDPQGSTITAAPQSPPAAVAPPPPSGAGPQNYQKVQIGMTSQQVVQLLGNPSRIKREKQKIEWEYYLPQGGKFELYLQNDKVVSVKTKGR